MTITLPVQAFEQLLPFHMIVDAQGLVISAGPTLKKIAGSDFVGRKVSEILHFKRPLDNDVFEALSKVEGQRLSARLCLREHKEKLRAVFFRLSDHKGLIALAKGHGLSDFVARYNLTLQDFSPCDPVLEMFFLIEANAAAMSETAKMNLRLQTARQEAEREAATDQLTGLYNRRAFEQVFEELCQKNAENAQPFSVMQLDLDYFKQVNDTFGHAAGDHVLREVSRVLNEEVRACDVVARMGGDEFVILFVGALAETQLDDIAKRIIVRLEAPILFENNMCHISVSAGTTMSKHYAHLNADTLLSDADQALYASKRAGRAQHTLFRP